MTTQTFFGSKILDDSGPTAISVDYWRSLYYFNLYRLALAMFFVTVAISGAKFTNYGQSAPTVFFLTSIAYAFFGLASLVTITKGWPAFRLQAQIQFFVDILSITLLIHSSGGVESGLGLLLIVSVAATGVVLGGRMTIFFASVATVGVLLEHTFAVTIMHSTGRQPTQLALLGVGLFVTAFLFYGLVKRIRRIEELAESRGFDLANLEQVNRMVIERMHTGVLATDDRDRIRVVNETALGLLGLKTIVGTWPKLGRLAPELSARLRQWRQDGVTGDRSLHIARSGKELVARFIPLGEDNRTGSLIYLDDRSLLVQQSQQLKLAALGRLSASMAHEIRNPLGAISHAGQLLGESDHLGQEDRRLIDIIRNQSRRIDQMIEGVMQLGRRDSAHRQPVQLGPWIDEFISYFCQGLGLSATKMIHTGEAITASVDLDQLHQVLYNLCDNAIRHSPGHETQAPVELRTGMDENAKPYLDVIDKGEGIPDEIQDQIFEPFFTSRSRGTGLGLYIARELCDANHAQLHYYTTTDQGSRFRISFEQSTPIME
ncbi:MAG TPA: HAMP domain-containing histidine kinase [Acidiferrobacteraceae bacterium]|nr:HAMP domain-containing histidine kinase [Acidiferrobacteraceae bacterium]